MAGGLSCLGIFFLTLYTSTRSTADSGVGVDVLFGSVFGLSSASAQPAAWVAAGICAAMLLLARPLLFASLDETVAAARGVPVRLLGTGFLALAGACAAVATQAVGALLLLGLLAAPAGAAQRLTSRPYRGLALAVGLAVREMWAGLALSYAVPSLPPSFAIVSTAVAVYAMAVVTRRPPRHRVSPPLTP